MHSQYHFPKSPPLLSIQSRRQRNKVVIEPREKWFFGPRYGFRRAWQGFSGLFPQTFYQVLALETAGRLTTHTPLPTLPPNPWSWLRYWIKVYR